jgi:hypothetical protein
MDFQSVGTLVVMKHSSAEEKTHRPAAVDRFLIVAPKEKR